VFQHFVDDLKEQHKRAIALRKSKGQDTAAHEATLAQLEAMGADKLEGSKISLNVVTKMVKPDSSQAGAPNSEAQFHIDDPELNGTIQKALAQSLHSEGSHKAVYGSLRKLLNHKSVSFTKMDADGDGLVSRAEFVAAGGSEEGFAKCDTNKDGTIDVVECRALGGTLDGDGVVTAKEVAKVSEGVV